MASIQIPNLPAVVGLDGTELFEGVQAGTSVKISLNQMIAAAWGGNPVTLPIPVSLGGTGVATLTGYVKGSATSPFTASPTIPNTDITGLGTMSTQNADAVAITGGTAALTGASSVTVNSASAAFTVTQTGAGNAFVVEDSASDTTPFVIDPVGNVGIGTATGLTKKLNLASDATSAAATRMTNSANTLGFEVGLLAGNADASAYIYQRANSVMFFGTNNLTRMTIDNSGNVGIGATPSTKLDVRGGSIVAGLGGMVLYGRLDAGFPSAAFNTGYFALGTNNTDASNGGLSIYTMAASTLSERMRIDASGNVGIGTSSPTSNLQIYNANSSITTNEVAAAGSGVASTRLKYSTNHFGFYVGSANALVTYDYGAAAERMRIDASGNVGIGASAPSSKLELRGASPQAITISHTNGTGYDTTLTATYSATKSFEILSGGFSAFSLRPTDGAAVIGAILRLDRGASAPVFWLNGASGTDQVGLKAGSGGLFAMEFYTGAAERMRITSGGNVGIGTTSPAVKLQVDATSAGALLDAQILRNGSSTTGTEVGLFFNPTVVTDTSRGARISGFNEGSNNISLKFYTGAGASIVERMRIDSIGNVGIGATANPASIIDAQSTTKGVRFPNMTTAQKTAMANVAGNVVFDTTLGKLCVNSGSGWQTITSV